MKRTIVSLLCSAALCAAVLPMNAMAAGNQNNAKKATLHERNHNQQERIQQGVKSGELTRRETARLEKEEARIRTNEAFAKADGKITEDERERLNKELNKVSEDIYDQKHDAQEQK